MKVSLFFGTILMVAVIGYSQSIPEIAIGPQWKGALYVSSQKLMAEAPRPATPYPYTVAAPIPTTIDIDTTKIRPFNNNLLGLNCSWKEPLYGSKGFNTPIAQDLLRQFKPTALRFPHGIFSNWYDWEVDGRRIYDDYPLYGEWKAIVDNVPYLLYGFQGFTKMHDELKFEVMWTWNVLYDDVEKSNNRLKDHMQKGFDVKWVELGNECFYPNMRSNKISTVELYLAHTKVLTKGLKEINPNLKVAININYRQFNNAWNTAVQKENFYDALQLHRHIGTGEVAVPTISTSKAIFNAKKILQESLNECKTRWPGKAVWLTEWSVAYGPYALGVLGTMDAFMTIFENDDLIEHANYFQMNEVEGLITFDKENQSFTKTSHGAAYEALHAVFYNSNLLESTIKTQDLEPGNPSVLARAVQKDGQFQIFAVNLSDKPSPLTVTWKQKSVKKKYFHKALTFKNLDDFYGYKVNEDPLTTLASNTDAPISLPPLSISIIGFGSSPTTSAKPLLAAVNPGRWVDVNSGKMQYSLYGYLGRDVSIDIYNPQGKMVKSLFKGKVSKDRYQIIWRGEDSNQNAVSKGVYFVVLNLNGHKQRDRFTWNE